MAKKRTKKIPAFKDTKPYRSKRFGILNHIGGIWTPETFVTQELAQAHLDREQATWPGGGEGLRRHKVIPVRVTVSAIKRPA